MYTDVEIERDGQRPLAFEGRKVAEFSTKSDGKKRWSNFTIWVTVAGTYITHIEGCSSVPGEVTLTSAYVHKSAIDMIRSFERSGGISDAAWHLLDLAAQVDDDIAEAMDAYESSAYHVV